MKGPRENATTAVGWHSKNAKSYSRNFADKGSFRERFDVWSSYIDKYSKGRPSALDLGCGEGTITVHLSRKCVSVCAVDASSEMLGLAVKRANHDGITNINFTKSDIFEFQQSANREFNLIISSSVFEYLEDIGAAFSSTAKLLSENGVLLVSVPNRRSLIRKLESLTYWLFGRPYYFRFVKQVLDLQQLIEAGNASGLTYIEHKFYGRGDRDIWGLRRVLDSAFFQPLFVAAFNKLPNID